MGTSTLSRWMLLPTPPRRVAFPACLAYYCIAVGTGMTKTVSSFAFRPLLQQRSICAFAGGGLTVHRSEYVHRRTRDYCGLSPTSLSFSSTPRDGGDDELDSNTDSSQEDSGNDGLYQPVFAKGDIIQAEVISFGPLGASVDVVAHNTHDPSLCISPDEPALGRGMVLQREIEYFRRSRGGADVVKYEVVPAYVESVREEDGRLDVSLRPPGGRAKAEELGETIVRRLEEAEGGMLPVGDKSSPGDIDKFFPGASKGSFKKAVSALYKKGVVAPGPDSISLMR